MIAHRSAVGIEVHATAKLNLFLEVVSKRSDGFHEVITLIAPVRLFDTLILLNNTSGAERTVGAIRLSCHWTFRPTEAVPVDSQNLAVRAVELLRERTGVKHGAQIRLIKRIPVAAGMGGASSDAAAALVAANEAWGLGWTIQKLATLAAELGSDVPFFLTGGAAICRGRGELVQRVRGLGDWHAVIVHPPAGLLTGKVYSRCRVPQRPHDLEPLLTAMRSGRLLDVGRSMHNRLQPAAAELTPWVDRLHEAFNRLECPAHQLTGSGTAYFGLCRQARQARRLAEVLSSRIPARVFSVSLAT